ncbi:amidohydrolase [Pseudoxanthomonas broegbernensis]|uniref:Amidohydrolase n=1 Tax=Pseudoxanthomonas broegbernensis TaxID=83619 RepID=A0A7V8K647_9GAMM|nr:amidohydrolase family protein [Pseudoxanthomonas broegbernensis]KAF1684941.1 amidohydrolase [Pseudoxanthomonas broegbernensis]MBB6066312.1 N-acyl-D-aspartate/D-glutamate deacylase [Pseudoxanthomonas broegbernensis]
MPRIRRLRYCLWIALALAPAAAGAQDRPADLAIVGGLLHDGGEHDRARVRDLVIGEGRVLAVGPDAARGYRAARTIDARGLAVAPGFIDPHTHPDRYIRADDPLQRRNLPWLFQGVTTLAIGVDGGGAVDIARQRAWFAEHGVGTHLVPYVGLGPVRRAVLGESARAPDAVELARMEALVAQAMCEGAFGLSTGLFYAPQSFAGTGEVVALARQAARRGGLYDTHQRDESSYGIGLLASTAEAIEIGRRAGLPMHFAHLKALGADVHGQAGALVRMIEDARAQGLRVTADQYPWLASGTRLSAALLPRWAEDGGRPALLRRLRDPLQSARIATEMRDNLRRRGGAEALLLTSAGQPWTGRTLAQMAAYWRVDAVEAALRIVRGDGLPGSRPAEAVASFNMDEDDLRLLMARPWMATSSDGSDGHPRQYASFPEKYARYVRGQGVLDLDAFIHRSTGLTASILGLRDRGRLVPGAWADVVVFDPDAYAPAADYLAPRVLSRGVRTLLVDGVPAIDDGQATAALAGRMLRHRPPEGACP